MKEVLKSLVLGISLVGLSMNIMAKDLDANQNLLATPYMTTDMVTLQPVGNYDGYQLVVSGPEGYRLEQSFNGMHVPIIEAFDQDGYILPDGQYFFELRVITSVDAETRANMAAIRELGDAASLEAGRAQGFVFEKAPTQSGTFQILNGYIVLPEVEAASSAIKTKGEDGRADNAKPGKPVAGNDTAATSDLGATDRDENRDQVIADDLIVDGSVCVGIDCVNNENFGFDTIRLKENNLRIKFDDTSATGTFPSVDWQLTANDSASGGANKFSIDDITNGKTPFTVLANAPNNSLYVNASGNLGFGTSTPAVNLHVVEGNSPALRLEQDGSSGFTAQTWDLAGNETNFFIRDVTNGSKLPFRIVPGAPSNSIFVANTGDVGIGDNTPEAKLDVENGWVKVTDDTSRTVASGEASLLVEQNTVTTDSHVLMRLSSKGSTNFLFTDTADNVTWKMVMNGGNGTASNFQISRDGSGVNEFNLDHNGNLTVTGTVNGSSDRNLKENFADIDPNEILAQVLTIPVTSWNYKAEEDSIRHIGPMAQDFYAAFGVGTNERVISMADSAGVAFSAIQGLNNVIQEKDQRIKTLEDKLAAQEARLAALEKALLK